MTHAIKHRLTSLEARAQSGQAIHVIRPPGWMPDDEYVRWKSAETSKAPPGSMVLAVRFVRPGDAGAETAR